MKQFNLEKWLQDKSRKIVTRDGREVEIFYSDTNKAMLVGRISATEIHQYTKDGFQCDAINQAKNDLFFADEEEELTEFEKVLKEVIEDVQNGDYIEEESFDFWKDRLLDLARKEIQPEIDKEIDKAYKNIDTIVYDNGYKQGQYEIMEDLPKWKKAKKDEELDCHVAIQQDDRVVLSDFVQKDEYYITLDALKKLPKEE